MKTFLAISECLASSDIDRMFPRGPLMVWGTDMTYKYFRLTGDGRLLIGGASLANMYSRREQQRAEQVVRLLTRYLSGRFPGLRVKFAACWPGLIGVSKDFARSWGAIPVIPRCITAGAAGLPWAAALGRYLAEKVLDGRDDVDAELRSIVDSPSVDAVQAVLGAPAAFAISHGILKFSSK